MKYIMIAMLLLLTACTSQITATQQETVEPGSLESVPQERIPLSPTSTGERVTEQQLKACEERDILKEEIIPLKEKESELFALAKEQKIEIDRTNTKLKQVANKMESSLLSADQIVELGKDRKYLQKELDDAIDALRQTNKELDNISEELVQKERDSEFLRFRCAQLQ